MKPKGCVYNKLHKIPLTPIGVTHLVAPSFNLGVWFTLKNRSAIGTLHSLMYRVYDTHLRWGNRFPKLKLGATKSDVSIDTTNQKVQFVIHTILWFHFFFLHCEIKCLWHSPLFLYTHFQTSINIQKFTV